MCPQTWGFSFVVTKHQETRAHRLYLMTCRKLQSGMAQVEQDRKTAGLPNWHCRHPIKRFMCAWWNSTRQYPFSGEDGCADLGSRTVAIVCEVFFLPEFSHVQQWSVLEGHCLEADWSNKKILKKKTPKNTTQKQNNNNNNQRKQAKPQQLGHALSISLRVSCPAGPGAREERQPACGFWMPGLVSSSGQNTKEIRKKNP